MFRSVKNWLTILILALVALAMIVAWAYVVPPLANRLDQQKLAEQRGSVKLIGDTVGQWIAYSSPTGQTVILNPGALESTVGSISMLLNAQVLVLRRDQVVLFPTAVADSFDVGDYPMLSKALASAKVVQGVVTTRAGRYAATAVPLMAINVGTNTVAGVVLVIAPLRDVDAAVAAIVEDEIGQLAATFNIMAVRLRGAFAQVEYERDRVEVLLNDLSEGVVGLSEEGTVTIANPASADLLGEPVPVGAGLDETFPADVAEAWHESRREDETQAVVFVHGERTLEATTYPVAGAADFTSIVVLRDVTSQARLERARRDLIANASHEFKTPLFSLAGFLELIDEGNVNADEQREFLQLMRQQVDRLRNLAVSMLDLSRVEAGSIEMQPEDVDLEAVARSVLDEFQVQAQAKELTLAVDHGEAVTAWCDEQRLAQVLRALIDNAVKFSPQGSSCRLYTSP